MKTDNNSLAVINCDVELTSNSLGETITIFSGRILLC